jgi:hypothetical protein
MQQVKPGLPQCVLKCINKEEAIFNLIFNAFFLRGINLMNDHTPDPHSAYLTDGYPNPKRDFSLGGRELTYLADEVRFQAHYRYPLLNGLYKRVAYDRVLQRPADVSSLADELLVEDKNLFLTLAGSVAKNPTLSQGIRLAHFAHYVDMSANSFDMVAPQTERALDGGKPPPFKINYEVIRIAYANALDGIKSALSVSGEHPTWAGACMAGGVPLRVMQKAFELQKKSGNKAFSLDELALPIVQISSVLKGSAWHSAVERAAQEDGGITMACHGKMREEDFLGLARHGETWALCHSFDTLELLPFIEGSFSTRPLPHLDGLLARLGASPEDPHRQAIAARLEKEKDWMSASLPQTPSFRAHPWQYLKRLVRT